ncbi:MAG: SufB/SufD family protein [Candidatus Nealsonbacteria bacterium]
MKNVKNVHFLQIDHKIKNIFEAKEVTILPSLEAWQKFVWTRKFFGEKPKEGYFVWVKKQINFPLMTCITIASPKIFQDLNNLLIIEKNIKVKANGVCNAQKNNLCGTHKAKGKLILKEGVFLEYEHIHRWGEKDNISLDYEFTLEKNSRLIYNYQNLFPPENLKLKTTIHNGKNSSSNLNFVINSFNSKTKVKDTIFLEGQGSQGIIRLRLIGRKKSQIEAVSQIFAKAPGKGHLDCQGLLISKTAKISLIPQLVCQNKEAQITHEASIGKISEEELTYLRMRGLTEKEAIDLIVSGFLKL